MSLSLNAAELLEELVITASPLPDGRDIASPDSAATLAGGGNLSDLLRFEPNTQAGNAPGPIFAFRGLDHQGTPTLGTRSNPSLGVLAGAAPRSTNTLWAFGANAWDSAGLEIIPGPVLFGKGPVAQGGEIRLIPNTPVWFHQGHFLAEFGELGHHRNGLTGNFVIVPEKLAARLNIASEGNDGAITNITLDDDDFAAVRRDLLRGQIRWQPAGNDQSVFDLLLETERLDGNPLGLATTLPGGDLFDREVAINTRETMPVDRYTASLSGKTELGNGLRLEGEIAWQKMDGTQLADFDSSPSLDWFYNVAVDERRLTGGTRFHHEDEENRLSLGLYAESSEYAFDFSGIGFGPVPEGSPFTSGAVEELEMLALFARAERALIPKLWLTGGLRLDHQERDQTSAALIAPNPPVASRVETSSTEWLPEIGLEWRDGGFTSGIRIARSYRPAGAAYAATLGALQPYGAERGWEINLHAANTWDNLRLSGRLFYATLDNQQVPYVATGGFPILDQFIANTGSSTRGGAELELRWKGPSHLHLAMAGGWLHTRYDELVINGADRAGQEFPMSPEFTSSLQLAWSPPVGWFCETALTWTDTSYSQAASPQATALEKRLLLSARTGYRWQNAEFYLFGTNLLNEDFALVRQDYTGIGRGIDGRPNLPRLLGLGLSINW